MAAIRVLYLRYREGLLNLPNKPVIGPAAAPIVVSCHAFFGNLDTFLFSSNWSSVRANVTQFSAIKSFAIIPLP